MNNNLKNQIRHMYHQYFRIPYSRILGDRRVIERLFKRFLHKDINWDNPQDLNEKIHWLKLNTDTSIWTRLADKYLVREYLKDQKLDDILIPLYGKWDTAEDIDFDVLPQSFVLKTNHGSGEIIKVLDKSVVDVQMIRKQMNRFLKEKYGFYEGAYTYMDFNEIYSNIFIDVEETLVNKRMEMEMKKMFGFEKSKTLGAMAAGATGALVMNAINKIPHKPAKGGSSGGNTSSGSEGSSSNVRTATTNPLAALSTGGAMPVSNSGGDTSASPQGTESSASTSDSSGNSSQTTRHRNGRSK